MSDALATKDDPKNTLSYRLARAAVIILGVLLVIALVTLVVGLALKLGGHRTSSDASSGPQKYSLPAGSQIVGVDSQPGRLIIHVRSPSGDEIDIVDTETGRLVGQIKAAEAGR